MHVRTFILVRLVAAACALAGTCLAATAQTYHALQETALRSGRGGESASIGHLVAGQSVTLVQMTGGWAQVALGPSRGWVRASQLDLGGAEVSRTALMDSGRNQSGATSVTLGVRALPPRNTRFAFIVGVSRYLADPARPAPPLEGSPHDVASALEMARMLQVPLDNITVLQDENATHDNVQQAVAELDRRVRNGDRVFIYWSGHGSRFFDPIEKSCVETLVPYDLHDISNRQFAQWLQPVAAKTDKMLVVYDACHSEGMGQAKWSSASRSMGATITAKALPSADSCQSVTNIRSRGLDSAVRDLGVSDQDFAFVSSSRSDEVSFDNAKTGGLATTALRECMDGDARDLDGSGSISVSELATCAQEKVEANLRPFPQLDPQHLVISGNRSFVPAWFVGNPAPHVTAPAASDHRPSADIAAESSALPTQQQVDVVVSPALEPAADLRSVLEQLHAQRDGKRRVEARTVSDRLGIGSGALDFSVTSNTSGYVYVALLGSDRHSLYLLFPNELDRNNRIEAGETLLLPRAAWRVRAQGPKGVDTLLVMVTDAQRDLSTLDGKRVGPFSMPLTDLEARGRLQWLLGQGHRSAGETCEGVRCSDAFGAALFDVEEY